MRWVIIYAVFIDNSQVTTWVGTWEDKNLDQQHDALFTKPWTKIRWSFAGHWQTCASLSPSILSPDAIFSPPPSLCHPLPTKWDRLLAFSLLIKLYFLDCEGFLECKDWIVQNCADIGLWKNWVVQNLDRSEIGMCRNWKVNMLDCPEIGSCKIWIMQKLDHAEIGLCRNWIVQKLDHAEIGLCRYLIMQILDCAKIWLCRNWIV